MASQQEAKSMERAIRNIPVEAAWPDIAAFEASAHGLWCLVAGDLTLVHANGNQGETALDDELTFAQILRWVNAHPERIHRTHEEAVAFVRLNAMATATIPPVIIPSSPPVASTLENGDHLTRDEFERRYDAAPHLKKAELINGVVHMPSPVRYRHHGKPHFAFNGWLTRYWTATPGVDGGDNATLRLDLISMPQPDNFLIILPEHGGRVTIDEDDYVVGGPELVAEVSASSVSYDLHEKLEDYRRNGVQEYVVWRVEDRAVDWFVNRNGLFEPAVAENGIFRSTVFAGLWLDVQALISGDRVRVAQVVDDGLNDPQHAKFVEHLRQQLKNQNQSQ